MIHKVKRYLAAVLSLAMVLTLLPPVEAKADTIGTTTTINASKVVVSGGQSGISGGVLVATDSCGTAGSNVAAAFVSGETGTSAEGNLGSTRVGGMAFALPDAKTIDADAISKAEVTITITGVNGNLGERFTKAGLFRVDASRYDTMVTDSSDNVASTYPAVDEKYDYNSTVFSNEQIAADNLGKKTFDVTDWVKASIKNGDSYAIYRIETVLSGFIMQNEGADAPQLAITVMTEQDALKAAAEELTIPTEVDDDITLPTTGSYGTTIRWASSDTSVMTDDGKVLDIETDKKVTLTATITKGSSAITPDVTPDITPDETNSVKKEFVVTVKSKALEDLAAFKEDGSITIANADHLTNSITLPTSGKHGTPITWTSEPSADGIITLTDEAVVGYDKKPAGVITRGTTDQNLKLTATMTVGGETATKDFDITVKAKEAETEITEKDLTDYMMAYFVGDGAGQEKIYFATSRDGLNWEEINDAQPMLESTLGEEGVRDPYIFRSAEGDKFYLIATDLCIGAGKGWSVAQTAGSQAVMIWESTDLVNWSKQRMVTVSAEIEAGCTWAPEVYYDDKTEEYILFWASKVKSDNYSKQRVYYAKTRDFYSFSEPNVWIDMDGISTIDTTVVRDDDGTYYRFTKNENGDQKRVFIEKSDSMLGTWTTVNSTSLYNEQWVEGPCCFKFNSDDRENANAKWCLLLDNYGSGGYYPVVTKDLSADEVEFTNIKSSANLPKIQKPRHGTVMPITTAEYNALMEAYGTATVSEESIPEYVKTGYELPSKVKVTMAGDTKEVDVTWTTTNDAFKEPGIVIVEGIIPSMNNHVVSKTVEVVASDLIYFIDSGVGSWNEDRSESSDYNKVSKVEGVTLRNTTADQQYDGTKGSWGIVGVDSAVGNRTSATDSIYTNGWWAKANQNCEYVLPLESGTYQATGYFSEWWWSAGNFRRMNFYATYVNDSGKTITSEMVAADVDSSADVKATLTFNVRNVKDAAEVHLVAAKSGDADPVISGLAVRKLADGAKVEAARAEAVKAIDTITVTPAEKSLYVGDTETITINYPEGLDAKLKAAEMSAASVKYRSSKSTVASVASNGKITAKAAGKATITTTITYDDGNKKELKTEVTVTAKSVEPTPTPNPTPAPSDDQNTNGNQNADNGQNETPTETTVSLDKKSLTLGVKETYTLKTTVEGAAKGQAVTYSTSKSSVAAVSASGKVTAKKKGTATITVKTADGKTATCKITVKTAPKKVTVKKKKITLKKGKSTKIKVQLPKNTASNKITFTSGNKKVAKVDANGKVTAVKKGKTKITVKTFNNKKAVVTVTVK